jgi:hypothetical protein
MSTQPHQFINPEKSKKLKNVALNLGIEIGKCAEKLNTKLINSNSDNSSSDTLDITDFNTTNKPENKKTMRTETISPIDHRIKKAGVEPSGFFRGLVNEIKNAPSFHHDKNTEMPKNRHIFPAKKISVDAYTLNKYRYKPQPSNDSNIISTHLMQRNISNGFYVNSPPGVNRKLSEKNISNQIIINAMDKDLNLEPASYENNLDTLKKFDSPPRVSSGGNNKRARHSRSLSATSYGILMDGGRKLTKPKSKLASYLSQNPSTNSDSDSNVKREFREKRVNRKKQKSSATSQLNEHLREIQMRILGHTRAAYNYDQYEKYLGYPTIILTSLISSSLMASLNQSGSNHGIEIFAFVLSILTFLLNVSQNYFAFGKKHNSHDLSAKLYITIMRNVETKTIGDRLKHKEKAEIFKEMISQMSIIEQYEKSVPMSISRDIRMAYADQDNGQYEINTDDSSNG